MDAAAFHHAIRYIYMFDSLMIPDGEFRAKILTTARKLQLMDLVSHIESIDDDSSVVNAARTRRQQRESDLWKARLQFQVFVEKQVIHNKVILKADDPDLSASQLAQLSQISTAADVILEVVLDDGSFVYYPAHKTMLMRSEYYQTMFTSSFVEAEKPDVEGGLPILELVAAGSEQVAEIILLFLYTDAADVPISLAMDVLYAADQLLIDKLKTIAAIAITSRDEPIASVYDILKASWATRMDRLERYAAKHFADNLARYVKDEEFADIVLQSANRIQHRQETDTIELIDDIRFYLAKRYGIMFEDDMDQAARVTDSDISIYEQQYNAELDRIEGLLENLGLDA